MRKSRVSFEGIIEPSTYENQENRTIIKSKCFKEIPTLTYACLSMVYILTNHPRHTTLYAGSTIDLPTRVWEHLMRQSPKSFTARYNVTKLVYYEPFEHIDDAVKREWFIKGKNRKWKEDLINRSNREWRDLAEEIMRCYR